MAKRQRDPLLEIANDCMSAFDGEELAGAALTDFLRGCLETAKERGVEADLEALLPYAARASGLSEATLRAGFESERTLTKRARKATGSTEELAMLRELRSATGRHGMTFSDAAAKTIAKAWPRLAGEALGKALFSGSTVLRLTNLGQLQTLEGLEVASKLTWLEIEVAPRCDLSPLAKLTKLGTLLLVGRTEGFHAISKLPKLTTLTVTTSEAGLAELAAFPILRVLRLTVDKKIPLAGLLDLAKLNLLELYAGERKLDDDAKSTITKLARKKGRTIHLSPREAWASELGLGTNLGWQIRIPG
ncbi:MAG: hypothetical protein JNK04_20870 [Myxococcales bacterium]|nr:hypothetical protein [Myxococcales bacterium]